MQASCPCSGCSPGRLARDDFALAAGVPFAPLASFALKDFWNYRSSGGQGGESAAGFFVEEVEEVGPVGFLSDGFVGEAGG